MICIALRIDYAFNCIICRNSCRIANALIIHQRANEGRSVYISRTVAALSYFLVNVVIALSVLVNNEAGVLSQVSRMFSRKGYNIESLAVGTTEDPKVSRITIEVMADAKQTNLLCNQLRKLFPVHSVKILDLEKSIRRELVLLKVNANTHDACNRIIQIANIFRASIIDVSTTTLTIAMIGDASKAEAIIDLVKEFGVLELVRTGMVALERGADTIYEATKEKGEFDYGKNVL